MTTAGTPQAAGELWENMLVCAETCLIEVIERLKQIAPVDVVMVRGNHDSNSTYTIGRTLWAYFDKDKNVTVTNSGKYIEYYVFKDVLIALLHGHTVRLSEIDRIISHEARDAWGKAKLVEAILGHFHHENVKTNIIKLQDNLRMRGVTVRIGDTTTGLDEWHRMKNYTDIIQRTQTYVYSSDRIENIIYSYVKG
jgi:UDP-2,3-diacylglucosamine pyrophosphatase LpxH